MKFFLDEKGSMTPLWAIGGSIVLLSIFWVDNVSWSFLEKIRQMNNADTLTRIAMIGEGTSSSTAYKVLSAVSATDNTAFYQFENNVNYPDLETIDERVEDGHLMSPFSNTATSYKTVSVPFTGVNNSLGLSKKVQLSTTDRAIKLFKPVNVIIAVENTPENRNNFSMAKKPLMNALERLYQQAPASRVSLIPYAFRINYLSRCYTGIQRGDNFDFPWWEMYFNKLDEKASKQNALSSAKASLSNALWNIKNSNNSIANLKEELKKYDQGTAEYYNVSEKISSLTTYVKNLEETIPQGEKNVEYATDNYEKINELVQELEATDFYKKYKSLAMHYAKRFDNYKILEDYKDEFANTDDYRINENDFLSSSVRVAGILPYNLRNLSVTRNGPFSDSDTCPAASVVSDMSSIYQVSAAFSRLDFYNTKIKTLEGLLWAGRQANSMNSPGARNVIVLFVSDKDDVLDDNKLLGVRESCSAIKTSYYNRRSSKIILVTKNTKAMEKFNNLNCATGSASAPGYIVQDEIASNFEKQMELNFMYLFSQESTTREVN